MIMSCPYIASLEFLSSLEFLFYNVDVNYVNLKIEVKIKTVCLPITNIIRNFTDYMYLVWLLRNIIDINIFELCIRFLMQNIKILNNTIQQIPNRCDIVSLRNVCVSVEWGNSRKKPGKS